MRAIRFEEIGRARGPSNCGDRDPGARPKQVLIRHEAIGVNFIETYQRSGLYPMKLPSGLGGEAAGVVEAVGDEVTRFKAGDRVATAGSGSPSAYADLFRVAAADRAVALPDGIDFRTAAASPAEGHDGGVPAAASAPGRAGRDDPRPCGGRRRRPDHGPMGQGPRRRGDRHGGLGGKSDPRPASSAPTM